MQQTSYDAAEDPILGLIDAQHEDHFSDEQTSTKVLVNEDAVRLEEHKYEYYSLAAARDIVHV